MKPQPLSVAITALIDQNKILLIQRNRGDYVGLLALPGGKIEADEHIQAAAIREIGEESGIESEFVRHLGVVSELLVENGKVLKHLILHVCELKPLSTKITIQQEGELNWYDLSDLPRLKSQIIPSDYLMIEKMVLQQEKNYFDCVLVKEETEYRLESFG